MDLGDADVRQRAKADRRDVGPPIQVEMAMWSEAGQLDWWVKNGGNGGVACGAKTILGGRARPVLGRPRAGGRLIYIWDSPKIVLLNHCHHDILMCCSPLRPVERARSGLRGVSRPDRRSSGAPARGHGGWPARTAGR